jgi:hypothetical protein
MPDLIESIQENRDGIVHAAARRGVRNVRLFGSVARGEARPDSDVDVLVDLAPGRNLFDLGGFAMDLEALLGRRVHAVTEGSIHWYIRDRVLREARPL